MASVAVESRWVDSPRLLETYIPDPDSRGSSLVAGDLTPGSGSFVPTLGRCLELRWIRSPDRESESRGWRDSPRSRPGEPPLLRACPLIRAAFSTRSASSEALALFGSPFWASRAWRATSARSAREEPFRTSASSAARAARRKSRRGLLPGGREPGEEHRLLRLAQTQRQHAAVPRGVGPELDLVKRGDAVADQPVADHDLGVEFHLHPMARGQTEAEQPVSWIPKRRRERPPPGARPPVSKPFSTSPTRTAPGSGSLPCEERPAHQLVRGRAGVRLEGREPAGWPCP